MRLKAFVIHLKSATGRWPQVQKLIEELPLESEVIDAVSVSALDDMTGEGRYERSIHRPHYPFALNKPEIACFLSHRRAWQAIVDQDLDAALVVEDDVGLTDGFAEAFRLARKHLKRGDFLRFRFRADRAKGEVIARSPTAEIVRELPPALGLVAQLVTREAAQKLLDTTRVFDRPADTTLQMFWITGVRPVTIQPGGVEEISSKLGGSTIKHKKTVGEKVAREILRPLYRRRIAVLARKFERNASAVGSHPPLPSDHTPT